MAAISAGLKSPPIKRLSHTWQHVHIKNNVTLRDLEKIMDGAHNFKGYKKILSTRQPPCVPFIGPYLADILRAMKEEPSSLQEPRMVPAIQEMTRFQTQPYTLTRLAIIRIFLKKSLAHHDKPGDFSQLSLEKESTETEGQRMGRFLREDGVV